MPSYRSWRSSYTPGNLGALLNTAAMALRGVALLGLQVRARPTPRLGAGGRILVPPGLPAAGRCGAGGHGDCGHGRALARRRIDIDAIRCVRTGCSRPYARTAPGAAAAAALDVDGLSPLVTPNASFYRIDTALVVPRVDPDSWTLGISGMVMCAPDQGPVGRKARQ